MGVNESDPADAANLEKVDHVVVLMLENRSFDHMLGYLSLTGGRPEIDGLRPGLANQDQERTYPVHHLDATALEMDPDHSASAIDQQVAGGRMSGFVASAGATLARRGLTTSIRAASWATTMAPTCRSKGRQARRGLSPQYPGLRVAHANHLGELLTRTTPRPAPLRDTLVRQATARGAQTETRPPRSGRRGEGEDPLNDLQKSILAATDKLRRDGHPSNAP